eukprot:6172922-Pleurochrysis_carterae.AAC.2
MDDLSNSQSHATFFNSGAYLFVTACHDVPPTVLLSSARLVVTVGDKIRRQCRCQADNMMMLPGRHCSGCTQLLLSPQPQGSGDGSATSAPLWRPNP